MITRRRFVQTAAGATAYLAGSRRAQAFQQSPTNLRKFIIGLPGLGPGAKNEIGQYIPVAAPNKKLFYGNDFYTLVAGQYNELMHPDLPKQTRLWGYADLTPLWSPSGIMSAPSTTAGLRLDFQYLGPLIAATRGRAVRLTMFNLLPPIHPLPVDTSANFPEAKGFPNKICVHLHGGLVPWISDGGPFAWFTPLLGPKGPDYPLQTPDMPRIPGAFNYYFPNDQSARLLWYHDHAIHLTRLNAYAGMAAGYLISDDAEAGLVNSFVIPSSPIPLIIQDKGFKSKWDWWGAPGDLWYPSAYEGPPTQSLPSSTYTDVIGCAPNNQTVPCGTGRWERDTAPGTLPLPFPSCVPEAFFDTITINGAVFPYLSLPAKRYRFLMLNGSQARFFNLQIYKKDNSPDGITLQPTGELDNNGNPVLRPSNPPGPAFIQIGTEGGFLPAPVLFSSGGNVNSNRAMGYNLDPTSPTFGNATRYNLVLAPAERADVIMDLRGFENSTLVVYNDAPAPFPGGDIRYDYFVGAPDLTGIGGAPAPRPGKSPNTRTLMVIKVGATAPDNMTFTQTVNALATNLPIVFRQTQPPPLNPAGVPVRQLGLYEATDQYGRLTQMMGTLAGPLPLTAAPTEMPVEGSTEVWQIFNFSGDTHPLHFHLVNVQVISRAPFISPTSIGPERPPDPNEAGWKETVRMEPAEVIKVIMKFDLAKVPFKVPLSTRTGVKGHEYVYHCHILEHEEHDMMRPLIVLPKP
jgi:spore coat protein A, manganese oxidase